MLMFVLFTESLFNLTELLAHWWLCRFMIHFVINILLGCLDSEELLEERKEVSHQGAPASQVQ